MNEPVFILKGNIVYSKNKDELRILKDHYLISESGLGRHGGGLCL